MRSIHQNPVGDGIRHRNREDCPCRPEVEELLGDSGKWETLVSHHALDVTRFDPEDWDSLLTLVGWIESKSPGQRFYVTGAELGIHADDRTIIVRPGEWVARGIAGRNDQIRPIPADIVQEEEL